MKQLHMNPNWHKIPFGMRTFDASEYAQCDCSLHASISATVKAYTIQKLITIRNSLNSDLVSLDFDLRKSQEVDFWMNRIITPYLKYVTFHYLDFFSEVNIVLR